MNKKSFSGLIRVGFSVIALAAGLAGCSSTEEEKYVERSVEELYNEGRALLSASKHGKAAQTFDEIERQHPYSEWASQAQLMSAYAWYLNQKYEKALAGFEAFLSIHPSHTDAAYASYMRALCFYEQISTPQRDQKVTQTALEAFRELIRKYPRTKYARDARIKVDLLHDHLAAREMDVGRYYQRKKAWSGAINRFKEVIVSYQNTSHVEEALHRLVEIYLGIGLKTEARKAAAVLGHNFPGSPWYADTYLLMEGIDFRKDENKDDGASWLDSVVFRKKEDPFGGDYQPEDVFMPPELEKDQTGKDLSRPAERLGTPSGYEKARRKVEEEKSFIENMFDFSGRKPDAEGNAKGEGKVTGK